MKTITLYDIYKSCPKCGHMKNYLYLDKVLLKETNEETIYKQTTNYICKNKHCENRWENDEC